MIYRQLGKRGLRVSEIALGNWMTDVSDAEKQELAAQSIQQAYENGVNFFDCGMPIALVLLSVSWGKP